MASETTELETIVKSKKRKPKFNKVGRAKKKANAFPQMEGKVKVDRKMKKLFRKRARDYNSDDDDEPSVDGGNATVKPHDFENRFSDGNSSGEEGANGLDGGEEKSGSEGGNEIQSGIMKFTDGCRAVSIAFKTITKKNVSDNPLGPVLSGHKKLVVEKLAEEEAERRVKGEAKREKHLLGEKGHVKPANFLDSHEKFLIGVATKGVVKLFNAVNKAQNAQKGLNPSRSKDAKALGRRRKEAFLAELHKKSTQAAEISSKGTNSAGIENDDGPAWAPLRDSYMLTSSKLKNWDKMQETAVAAEMDEMRHHSSSDED